MKRRKFLKGLFSLTACAPLLLIGGSEKDEPKHEPKEGDVKHDNKGISVYTNKGWKRAVGFEIETVKKNDIWRPATNAQALTVIIRQEENEA